MAESSSGDTTGGAADDTIYEIQDGTIAEGTDVDVRGVIITGMRDQVGMFVQEPDGGEYSGVYVDTGDIDLSGMAIGDEVDITGVTSEGFGSLAGLTAIDASGGTVVATGNGGLEPAATVVDLSDLAAPATAEPWEGVLVMVDEGGNVVVSAEPGFDEFEIEAGGDTWQYPLIISSVPSSFSWQASTIISQASRSAALLPSSPFSSSQAAARPRRAVRAVPCGSPDRERAASGPVLRWKARELGCG
jgi:hypothetical protein